ncbi:MAG: SH3 domain-containing protein [Clostridiales bacterium]|nr:SH3 domain-containing protein [Clostridiales bacterium]
MSKICSYCGTVNPDGNAYCPNCGKKFSDAYGENVSYEEPESGPDYAPEEDYDDVPAQRPKTSGGHGGVFFIILIVLALVSAGVLLFMVFRDDLPFGKKEEKTTVPVTEATTAAAVVTTVPATATATPLPAENLKANLCADGECSFVGRVNTVTGSGLNVRSAASGTSSVITTVKQNTVLTITKIESGWGYTTCRDEDGEQVSGWVSLDYIETSYRVNGGGANVFASAGGDVSIGSLAEGTQIRLIGVFGQNAYIAYGENGGYVGFSSITSLIAEPVPQP